VLLLVEWLLYAGTSTRLHVVRRAGMSRRGDLGFSEATK
jgi:hypothetical protein